MYPILLLFARNLHKITRNVLKINLFAKYDSKSSHFVSKLLKTTQNLPLEKRLSANLSLFTFLESV